jgi:hypothetical protein
MKNVEKVYNKLILIGNGFDLALDLKTSYNDFLFWLLKSEVLKALESFPQKVTNEKYTKYNDFLRQHDLISFYGFASNPLFDVLVKKAYSTIPTSIKECETLASLNEFLKQFNIEVVPKNKQSLFQKILELSKVNWIDIEETYFDLVKESLSPKKNMLDIDILNEDLEQISERLKEYLREIEIDLKMSDAEAYVMQFYDVIDKDDVIEKEQSNISPKHTYFLNFNYTESLSVILEQSGLKHFNTTINQIHSSAFSDEPIIFGFGDEMDEVYKKIEELNDNKFFKFIKSFHYFKSNKYRSLLRFLNSNYYQVCIYGHSCGLSDRVMLNEIFEHKNCKSIKIYYYNQEDFNTKTMNISRHFNSNKLMREKIVNFNPSDIIPQLTR